MVLKRWIVYAASSFAPISIKILALYTILILISLSSSHMLLTCSVLYCLHDSTHVYIFWVSYASFMF